LRRNRCEPPNDEASALPYISERILCSTKANKDTVHAPATKTGLGRPNARAASESKATTMDTRALIAHHRQNTSHHSSLSSTVLLLLELLLLPLRLLWLPPLRCLRLWLLSFSLLVPSMLLPPLLPMIPIRRRARIAHAVFALANRRPASDVGSSFSSSSSPSSLEAARVFRFFCCCANFAEAAVGGSS